MQRITVIFGLLFALAWSGASVSAIDALFRVSATGSTGTVNITLCLNGRGPLSCQNYSVTALTLSILTTAPNHTYPAAGIKINTPGYSLANLGTDCQMYSNGYCLFSVSNTVAKTITITPTSASIFGSFVGASCSGVNCIASGASAAAGLFAPLLAGTNNNGTTWSYRITADSPALPNDYVSNGQITSASCAGLNCIASGSYNNVDDTGPLVARSANAGVTWTYPVNFSNPALPLDYNSEGTLRSASCSGVNCIAAGRYNNITSDVLPLLAGSNDGGATWAYRITSSTMPPGATLANLYSASCSNNVCVTVGLYAAGGDPIPLVANSVDGGITWLYRTPVPASLPAPFSSGRFESVSCSGINCIAAGSYDDGSNVFPLLASSQNSGVTWVYRIDSNLVPTNFASTDDGLAYTSCSGLNCIASGGYNDGSGIQPMIAHSPDGGETWSYALDSSTPGFPGLNGSFNGVSCSGANCVASGAYTTNNGTSYTLLAHSGDGGITWTYISPGIANSSLNNVSCSGLTCAAGGTTGIPAFHPLTANSTNGGVTWTYHTQISQ